MIAWHVGGRDSDNAREFMLNLAGRLLNRVQLTTDGHGVYPRAVWEAFGTDIDYAQLVKIFGAPREGEAYVHKDGALWGINLVRGSANAPIVED